MVLSIFFILQIWRKFLFCIMSLLAKYIICNDLPLHWSHWTHIELYLVVLFFAYILHMHMYTQIALLGNLPVNNLHSQNQFLQFLWNLH